MTDRFAAEISCTGRVARLRLTSSKRDLFAASPELEQLAPLGGDTLLIATDFETLAGTVTSVDATGVIRVQLAAERSDDARRVTVRRPRLARKRCARPPETADLDIALETCSRGCACDACDRLRRFGTPRSAR